MKNFRWLFCFVLFSAHVSHAQWQSLNGPPGGNVVDIEIDAANNRLYTIVNNQRLYTSNDDANSWTEVNTVNYLYPNDLLIDGANLYFVAYSAFYKSEDAGATWQRKSLNNQFSGGQKLIKSTIPDTYFVYGYYGGIFVSTDAGVNWKNLSSKAVSSAVVTAAGDLLFFSQYEGIKKHVLPATGQQWAPENVSLVLANPGYSAAMITHGSTVYAATETDVLKSVDNGAAWTSIVNTSLPETYFYDGVWAKAGNGVYLALNYARKLYFTSDGGANWSTRPFPSAGYGSSSVNVMTFATDTKAFAGCSSDGIFKTTNGAAVWSLATAGINSPAGRSVTVAASGRIIVTTGYDSKGYWYSDDGTWKYRTLPHAIERVRKLPNNTLLGLGYYNLQYSTDNGNNWVEKTDGTNFQHVTFNATFSSNTYYAGSYSAISKSTDGINWTKLSITGLPSEFGTNAIAQDNAGTLFVYLYDYSVSKSSVYKIDGITAAGTTGTATAMDIPLGEQDQSGFYPNGLFVSNNKLYIGTYYHIYTTDDQGAKWKVINFSKNSLFPLKKGTDSGICAGTAGSLYISQDDGKSWSSTNLPSGNANGYILEIAEDAAGDYYAAGHQIPALKFTNELLLPAASLPPYVDFNWQPTNGPYGAVVTRLYIDNSNTAYSLSDGRMFKAPANLSLWTQKSSQYYYDFAADRAGNKLYATAYSQLFSSANGGDTWDLLNSENIIQRRYLRRCPNGDLIFAGAGNNVFVSMDGGTTFGSAKYSTTTHTIRDIIVTSANAIIVYMRDNSSPFHYSAVISTDRGATWNAMNLNATGPSFSNISADGQGNIYSTVNPASKSADNGATWTSIQGDLPAGPLVSKVFISASNVLYAVLSAGGLSLYKSTNGGTNWTKTASTPNNMPVYDIAWMGTRMVLAMQDGVNISDDDGATFTGRTTGIPPSGYGDLAIGGPSRVLVSNNFNVGFSTSDGSTWSRISGANFLAFLRKPDGTLMAHDFLKLYQTADQGDTWTSVSNLNGLSRVATANGTTFYGTTGNRLYVTSDLASWTEVQVSGLPAVFSYDRLAVDENGFVYALVRNNVAFTYECYQIVFGGATRLVNFTNPASIRYHKSKIFVYDRTGVISTTADGSTWATRSAPAGDAFIIADNGYYFIPQWGGTLWLSRDEGASWQNVGFNNPAGNSNFLHVGVNEFTGYAYATASNSVVLKSANIVIPAETVSPAVTALQPANGATNVGASASLRITFNEACLPVSGKKIRLFEPDVVNALEVLDASAGVQDGRSFVFTLSKPLAYSKIHFVIVDNGAYTDIFGNTFGGIGAPTTWRFTTMDPPDEAKPVITFTPSSFVKASANKLQVTVTDETDGSGVNLSSVKLYYRGIMSDAAPTQAAVTHVSGSTFETAVSDAWLDDLGLEFYFEARDKAGNIQYSPADAASNGTFHRSYISFPETTSPALPSAVLSFGGRKENYRVFSIPYKLADTKISTVFSEITGLEVKKDFRILNFNPATSKYVEYPALSNFTRGEGYWVNVKTAVDIRVENASTPEHNKSDLFSFTLKPGWNQIGNPYPFTISWNAVKGADASIGSLKSFNGSTFIDDDKLNPFEGGFVLLNGSANVVVPVPFSAKTTAGRVRDPGPDFERGWMVPLHIANSAFHTTGGVGMHPEARAGLDRYDDALPPGIFDLPEISFSHEREVVTRFTRDVVPPAGEYVWDFTVHAGEGPAVLSWDEAAVRSAPGALHLLDEQQQVLCDMAERGHYQVPAGGATFRLFYGISREDIRPSRIMLGKPYPNPLTNFATATFSLPETRSGTYAVSLEVYDNLGRRVATLAQGEFSSGFYTRTWTPDPAGFHAAVYLCRLTVSDRKSTVVLTEKILTK